MAGSQTRREAHTARPYIPLGAVRVTHLLTALKANHRKFRNYERDADHSRPYFLLSTVSYIHGEPPTASS
jgi:hypothetical protein